MESKIYCVSELNNCIKNIIEAQDEFRFLYIKGEISNFKTYPSGHSYFSLKDSTSTISCTLFKGNAAKVKFIPKDGMNVIVAGKVDVYIRDGKYQINCIEMTADGVGDLYVAFEQLKEKLRLEGLFNLDHKKPIPKYPKNICVITSSAGAAVKDVIRVLGKRFPVSKVKVLPVRVQGVEAPPEIVEALNYANRFNVAELIILGRGGGSLEDLWAFNDERVARAIYASNIPIISAVGHEPDVTISDFVADLRAATPSNGAELAVPDMLDLINALSSTKVRIEKALIKKIDESKAQLDNIKQRRVLETPLGYIEERAQEVDILRDKLVALEQNRVLIEKNKFEKLVTSLDALSPLKVLGRGYTIATNNDGKVIKSASDVNKDDEINLRFKDNSLKCQVK